MERSLTSLLCRNVSPETRGLPEGMSVSPTHFPWPRSPMPPPSSLAPCPPPAPGPLILTCGQHPRSPSDQHQGRRTQKPEHRPRAAAGASNHVFGHIRKRGARETWVHRPPRDLGPVRPCPLAPLAPRPSTVAPPRPTLITPRPRLPRTRRAFCACHRPRTRVGRQGPPRLHRLPPAPFPESDSSLAVHPRFPGRLRVTGGLDPGRNAEIRQCACANLEAGVSSQPPR